MVDWVRACGVGPEVGGVDDGVAPAVGLVVGAAVAPPPAATTATRDELGGEAVVAGGVGMAPWVGGWQFQCGPGVWFVGGFL